MTTVEEMARSLLRTIADLENRRTDEIPITKGDWRLLMEEARDLAELCVTDDALRLRVEAAIAKAAKS